VNTPFDNIINDFPILQKEVHGKALVYLDNAATTQKPASVIKAISEYYENSNSNVHRGVHALSQEATDGFENARLKIKEFINSSDEKEIIFTKGTTDSINLLASSFGKTFIKKGDEILISEMEHHSNIVPWQMLCESTGATLKVAPINKTGEIELDSFERMLTNKTKLVSIVHVSNALGTINPIEQIIDLAHEKNIPVLVDGAQSAVHFSVDVQKMDCDFFAFSGHKMYGPTGIGVLYGKKKYLESLQPYQGGGDMIKEVTIERSSFADLPYKFEAGTPNIAGAIGLGAAIDYLTNIGQDRIQTYENELLSYAIDQLSTIKKLRFIGNSASKAGVVSFVIENIHPHDIGTIVDKDGIAVRTGHHCTQLVMQKFCVPATTRASFAFYNTNEDTDRLVESINKAIKIMS